MEDTSPFLKKKHDQKELYSTIEAVVEQTSKWSFDGGKWFPLKFENMLLVSSTFPLGGCSDSMAPSAGCIFFRSAFAPGICRWGFRIHDSASCSGGVPLVSA